MIAEPCTCDVNNVSLLMTVKIIPACYKMPQWLGTKFPPVVYQSYKREKEK